MSGFQYKLFLSLFAFWLFLFSGNAQEQFFKFKVSKEGIYHLTAAQARAIGATGISEVSIFGFPGMLPQLVDSSYLKLQEIPGLEKNGNLYFYLSSPHTYSYAGDGELNYNHHLFADSLSFLISKSSSPKRIKTLKGKLGPENPAILYQWFFLKEEENNILNSGRVWYSKSLAPRITRGYAFSLQSQIDAPWKVTGQLMSSARSASSITLAVDDLGIGKSDFSAIPNSTYGVKGRESRFQEDFRPVANKIDRVRISYQSSDGNASGYFEYLGFGVPSLSTNLGIGTYTKPERSINTFQISAGFSAWEISDFYDPSEIDFTTGNSLDVKKIIVFDLQKSQSVEDIKSANTSLRTQTVWPELIIIAPRQFKNPAEKLRIHKLGRGVFAEVYYLDEIYDAFGYGNKDLNAIRNLIAWHYHQGKNLKNVLLLGKGTFDYKGKLGGRPNLVPIYTSRNSLNPLTTFSSDDYFGLIDWGQGIWEESRSGDEIMQIGVGRLPVINLMEATIVVNKIIQYEENPAPGDWKKTVAFMADDADNNIHLRDSEAHAAFLTKSNPEFRQKKLYLDRYKQIKEGDRQSSPEAKKALEKQLQEGALFLNYVGHGNETTLTAEEVFSVSDIPDWANQDKLALWVTATCEFGRHDSPFFRSAAEELLTVANKGAIGLLTTGRPVFSSVNFSLNEAFIESVFKEKNGLYQDLGSIFKDTKNKSLNGPLNRNFSLLGDPSMRLAEPELNIEITDLKNPETGDVLDTLAIYQVVQFEAEVRSPFTKGKVSSYEGTYKIELRDKPVSAKTLGDESPSVEFNEESVLLFQGSGSISSGILKGELIIPKNTNPEFGKGHLRILGKEKTGSLEAYGSNQPIIGGKLDKISDDTGPKIETTFGGTDQPQFVFPSTVIPLVASFSDESGINISNLNPGEILQVQVNDNSPRLLNELFIAQESSFKKGNVTLLLDGFKEGENKVIFRAWDNLGNGSILEQNITVKGSERIQIIRHKTFPNPTQVESNFEIEHNRPNDNLLLTFSVYSLSGEILFSENKRLVKADAVIKDPIWIFSHTQTKYPAKGTYIYTISLQSENDSYSDSVSGKIVIQ